MRARYLRNRNAEVKIDIAVQRRAPFHRSKVIVRPNNGRRTVSIKKKIGLILTIRDWAPCSSISVFRRMGDRKKRIWSMEEMGCTMSRYRVHRIPTATDIDSKKSRKIKKAGKKEMRFRENLKPNIMKAIRIISALCKRIMT